MEIVHSHRPWNKGKLVGQKPPLQTEGIWVIRIHIQKGNRIRACDVQSRHRQQVARLRLGESSRSRRRTP